MYCLCLVHQQVQQRSPPLPLLKRLHLQCHLLAASSFLAPSPPQQSPAFPAASAGLWLTASLQPGPAGPHRLLTDACEAIGSWWRGETWHCGLCSHHLLSDGLLGSWIQVMTQTPSSHFPHHAPLFLLWSFAPAPLHTVVSLLVEIL